MKKIVVLLAVAAMIFVLAGCFKHTYNVGSGAPNGQVVYDEWHSHWLFGIIGEETLDIKNLCPSGDATIHDEITFVNGLIGAFIGIVWYPTTVTVRCRGGGGAELELDMETAAEIVTDPGFIYLVEDVLPARVGDAKRAMQNAELYLANVRMAQAQ